MPQAIYRGFPRPLGWKLRIFRYRTRRKVPPDTVQIEAIHEKLAKVASPPRDTPQSPK